MGVEMGVVNLANNLWLALTRITVVDIPTGSTGYIVSNNPTCETLSWPDSFVLATVYIVQALPCFFTCFLVSALPFPFHVLLVFQCTFGAVSFH